MRMRILLTVTLLAVSLAGCAPAAEPEACPNAPFEPGLPPESLAMRLTDASEVLVAQVTTIGDDEVTLTVVETMKGNLREGSSVEAGLTSGVWPPVVGETSLWLLTPGPQFTAGPEFCAATGGARNNSPEEAADIMGYPLRFKSPYAEDQWSDATTEPAVLGCAAPGTLRANDKAYASAPPGKIASTITFATNCGDIVIALDPAAPATAASETFLAKDGFYDNTQCHRLTTAGIFVLQCGDPAGDGTGGPGYAVPDENLPAEGAANYPAGTVAMANAGPGTSGSQFFIVYDDTTLPSGYTIWGTVTEGLGIVKEIAAAGVAGGGEDGPPLQPVFIESATVQP